MRLIATRTQTQDVDTEQPVPVYWADEDGCMVSPATLEDFARVDGKTPE